MTHASKTPAMTYAEAAAAFHAEVRLPREDKGEFVRNTAEIIALLQYYAFDFAPKFGAGSAIAHITNLMERMVPLIDLRAADGVDDDTHCHQICGIQAILLCVRGTHKAEMKLRYISGYLSDAWRCWDGQPRTH